MRSLLEHAARVLDHHPTRSMAADALYRRSTRESGIDASYTRFLDNLREASDRFAVIPPDPVLAAIADWDIRQRSRYEAALESAGINQPLVILTERRCDNDPLDGVMAPTDGVADVLHEVQDTLSYLLRSCDPEEPLHGALAAAVDELNTARRVIGC